MCRLCGSQATVTQSAKSGQERPCADPKRFGHSANPIKRVGTGPRRNGQENRRCEDGINVARMCGPPIRAPLLVGNAAVARRREHFTRRATQWANCTVKRRPTTTKADRRRPRPRVQVGDARGDNEKEVAQQRPRNGQVANRKPRKTPRSEERQHQAPRCEPPALVLGALVCQSNTTKAIRRETRVRTMSPGRGGREELPGKARTGCPRHVTSGGALPKSRCEKRTR